MGLAIDIRDPVSRSVHDSMMAGCIVKSVGFVYENSKSANFEEETIFEKVSPCHLDSTEL